MSSEERVKKQRAIPIIRKHKPVLILLLCLLFGLISGHCQAQEQNVCLKRGARLLYQDTSIVISQDTCMGLDSSVLKARKGLFTRLFNRYLVTGGSRAAAQYVEPQAYDDRSAWYIGKTIGSIKIQRLDVFGTRITDTAFHVGNELVDFGNRLHIKTRSRVIRKNLLLKEGQKISPYLLGNNERILRALPYIKDCRIYVTGQKMLSDTVDILVVEKDIWPLDFGLGFSRYRCCRPERKGYQPAGNGPPTGNHLSFAMEGKNGI